MQNVASSEGHRGESSPSETERASEARQLYARKRAAEAARARCLVLGQVVQAEILPQLMLLHRGFVSAETKPALKPDVETVAAFTDLALAPDDAPIIEAFTALMAQGHPLDRLFIDLLAPAAALLGRMWDDDLCDFVEVTTGVARLQNLIARFRVDGDAVQHDGKRRLLLMSAPGEQHTFGVRIVEQFLRRAGWFVSIGLSSRPDEISALVASEWFAVVGLTLSNETRLEPLARAIRSVRQASCNRAIGVMVGGPVFLKRPELVEQVGADASAVDAATAVLLAQRLLEFGDDIAVRA
ncbi:cobalamin B12-binding domain-containing protein [Methylobacterium phyllosphaerae]